MNRTRKTIRTLALIEALLVGQKEPERPAWAFPWPEPKTAVDSDGPECSPGSGMLFDHQGCDFTVVVESAPRAGPRRYRATCWGCCKTLHESTARPSNLIAAHVREHVLRAYR